MRHCNEKEEQEKIGNAPLPKTRHNEKNAHECIACDFDIFIRGLPFSNKRYGKEIMPRVSE